MSNSGYFKSYMLYQILTSAHGLYFAVSSCSHFYSFKDWDYWPESKLEGSVLFGSYLQALTAAEFLVNVLYYFPLLCTNVQLP